MTDKSDWAFDATTSPESNRRILKDAAECPCCGHVHRNKGASILRCWVQIPQLDGRQRACKCSLRKGDLANARSKIVGPFWARGGRGPGQYGLHLWYHAEGGYMAWSLCGVDEGAFCLAGQVIADRDKLRPSCKVCPRHRFASRATNSVESVNAEPKRLSPRDTGSRLITLRQRLVWEYAALKREPRSARARQALVAILRQFRDEMKLVLPNLDHEIERLSEEF